MKRTMIMAAAVAALFALSAPAQAGFANPGLGALTAAPVQSVQFQIYIGPDGRRHHRRYHRSRYRHCWNHRYRVRYHHRWVWRTVRRCDWRYRY
jgi:hypothetical protein